MVLGNASCETISPSNLGRPHRPPARHVPSNATRHRPTLPLYAPRDRRSNIWRRDTCGPFCLDLHLDRPDNFLRCPANLCTLHSMRFARACRQSWKLNSPPSNTRSTPSTATRWRTLRAPPRPTPHGSCPSRWSRSTTSGRRASVASSRPPPPRTLPRSRRRSLASSRRRLPSLPPHRASPPRPIPGRS